MSKETSHLKDQEHTPKVSIKINQNRNRNIEDKEKYESY